MLQTASWVERVKHLTGLKAVSQVWSENPAWYFWIQNISGAYSLQLEASETDQRDDQNWQRGNFSIKYYPHPREDVLETFSFQERCYVHSDYFDRTHTPRFEHLEKIPETLFNVATVEYLTDSDEAAVIFSLTGLDAMRVSWGQEIHQTYSILSKEKKFNCGETDRNVPGWDLGLALFDRLLSIVSFYRKEKPLRIVMTRSAGFEFVFGTDHRWQCEDSSDLNMYSLNVLFTAETRNIDGAIEDMMDRSCLGKDKEILYDREFPCGHFPSAIDQFPIPVSFNEQWWSLAESDIKSELASTCGCS